MWECCDREINPAAFTKLHLLRECIRYSPKLLRTLARVLHVALCDAFLKSAKTQRRFVISVFPLVPRHDETFSRRAICRGDNAPCHGTRLQGFALGVSPLPYRTLFLNAELLPSALPRFPISFLPFPFVFCHLPSFRALRLLSYVLLSCPVIIYPGNIALPLSEPLLTREKYNIWEEKVSKKSM